MLRNTKIRIKEYPEGWVVEVQRSYLFGLIKYWTHLIGAAGMEHEPYHFSSFENAEFSLIRDVQFEVYRKSNHNGKETKTKT